MYRITPQNKDSAFVISLNQLFWTLYRYISDNLVKTFAIT